MTHLLQPDLPATGRSRRAWLAGLAGAGVGALVGVPALGHDRHGSTSAAGQPAAGRPSRGRAICAIPLTTAAGLPSDLRTLTRGYPSAVQLMFTACGSTCLSQGALFAEVQSRFATLRNNPRLLSISIDPLGDDAATLSTWLRKFNARPAVWTAAVAPPAENEWLLAQFRIGRAAPDRTEHLNRVFVFNRLGALSWATGVDPSPQEVMDAVARHG